MLAANEFLEWARVHRHLYGTARQQVWREMSEGRDIILELDVQGAASVRRTLNPTRPMVSERSRGGGNAEAAGR